MIRFQTAISPRNLSRYVSKYASKTPLFPNRDSFIQYAQTVYKLQMHRFSTIIKRIPKESEWVLIEISGYKKSTATLGEMEQYFDRYLNDYGFGS
jgi:hypothetical protein